MGNVEVSLKATQPNMATFALPKIRSSAGYSNWQKSAPHQINDLSESNRFLYGQLHARTSTVYELSDFSIPTHSDNLVSGANLSAYLPICS